MSAGVRAPSWDDATVAAAGRGLRLRVFRPSGEPTGWLVWAHGGSWVSGSVESWHPACADLADRTGAVVVSVDYRLAPRHRHPAALDDVLSGVEWAAQQAHDEGLDGRVAVGGDSAGGALAACAALRCRDEARPLSAQLLLYPPLDPACRASSYQAQPQQFPSRDGLVAAWQEYRGPGYRVLPGSYLTPWEAEDLDGVAPAIIGVGEQDPVVDDVRRYVAALRAAGRPAQVQVFAGMGHGTFLDDGAAGSALRGWLGTALRAHWGRR